MTGFSIHRCALCSAELGGLDTETVDQIMAAHHAVCPKRPIAPGDRVRVVRTTWSALHGRNGVIVSVDRGDTLPYFVKIDDDHNDGWWCHEVERVSPSEQRPKVGDIIPLEHRTAPTFPAGADRSLPCPTCSREWGEHFGIACSVFDQDRACVACGVRLGDHLKFVGCRGPAAAPTCAPGCQCGAHAAPSMCNGEHAAPACADPTCVQRVPLPVALIDGIDREACLARWMENRLAVEGGAVPPNAMTRMQRDVARALWLERYGAQRGAELRAKVEADREAERCRVRIAPEVEPWE